MLAWLRPLVLVGYRALAAHAARRLVEGVPGASAYAAGSAASGELVPGLSDLDLVVVLDGGLDAAGRRAGGDPDARPTGGDAGAARPRGGRGRVRGARPRRRRGRHRGHARPRRRSRSCRGRAAPGRAARRRPVPQGCTGVQAPK
ncbi:MAG: nucleotidyltransferase domain-containing protein [Thermoleophilia bacterium]